MQQELLTMLVNLKFYSCIFINSMLILNPDLLNIICDYLHCDIIPVPQGYKLELRPCKYFEIRTCEGRTMIFPCSTQ